MPRRPTRTVPTVLLHGLQGSGPEHWQSWLAAELTAAGREARMPSLPDADTPRLDSWLAALRSTLAGLPEDGYDVVAHSLGAVLWLHHAARSVAAPSADNAARTDAAAPGAVGPSPRPARVALVSPPSPHSTIAEIASFLPPPLSVDAVRAGAAEGTVLVSGSDDPYCPEGIAEAYGRPLKIATTVVPGGGHLNVAAGYGPWPAVLSWCNRDNLAFF